MNSYEDSVTAGVIGTGNMGQHHVRVYSELLGVDLTGVVDTNADRAREVADRYGTKPMDLDSLLHSAQVVSVCVPTEDHHQITKRCLEAGSHVLVEKPFVSDIGCGHKLAEMANHQNLTLQIGHVERFNPVVEALERFISNIDIVAIEAHRLGGPVEREISDSIFVDLMLHDIDIILSLVTSEVRDIKATRAKNAPYGTAILQFDNGVIGSLHASRITQNKIRKLSITGPEHYVVVDYIDQSLEIHQRSVPEHIERDGEMLYRHENIVEKPMVDRGEPLKNEIKSFIKAVKTERPPRVTPIDGIRAVEIAEAIERAADETL